MSPRSSCHYHDQDNEDGRFIFATSRKQRLLKISLIWYAVQSAQRKQYKMSHNPHQHQISIFITQWLLANYICSQLKASDIKCKATKQFKMRQRFPPEWQSYLFVCLLVWRTKWKHFSGVFRQIHQLLSFSSNLIKCRSDKVFTKLIRLKIVVSFKSSCQAPLFSLSLHLHTSREWVFTTTDSVRLPDCVLHFFIHLTLRMVCAIITCDSCRSQHSSWVLSGSVRQALTSLGSATFFQMCTTVYELSRR